MRARTARRWMPQVFGAFEKRTLPGTIATDDATRTHRRNAAALAELAHGSSLRSSTG